MKNNRKLGHQLNAKITTALEYGVWAMDFLKAGKACGKPFCMSISFKT